MRVLTIVNSKLAIIQADKGNMVYIIKRDDVLFYTKL